MLVFILSENRNIVVWVVTVICYAALIYMIFNQASRIDKLEKKLEDKNKPEIKNRSITEIYEGK